VGQLFEERRNYFLGLSKQFNTVLKARVVHVAGTKGKGSTVEYIAAGMRKHGKVGVFTSPHLHTARERVRVDSDLISMDDFTRLGVNSLNLAGKYPNSNEWIVFFDYLLTLAIQYFDELGVNSIVLETGIGGRYDSTNFLDSCAASVITRIGIDHQAMLGDSIEEIAWQKAGIIKEYGHVFTPANQQPSVLEVFRKECELKKATLHLVPVET
jgi:dihydrofolate synthase/folylpolyglutamate synthase